jgi:hypothetical protein
MYSDQKFYVNVPITLCNASWGTATASGALGNVLDVTAYIPQFMQKTKVNKVQLVCTVIPDATTTVLVASFMNGTDTMGTAVLTTATAEQVFITTISTNNTFTASSAVSIKLTGTTTDSDTANGSWVLGVEAQELFS